MTGRAALMTARIACLPNVNHKWSLSWAGAGGLKKGIAEEGGREEGTQVPTENLSEFQANFLHKFMCTSLIFV